MSEISFKDLHESMEETSIPKVELVDPTTLAFKTREAQHLPCYLLDTHSVNEDFSGREDILKLLANELLPPKNRVAASNPPFRQFALCRIGGIGKTEIAHEFVRRRLTNFDAVFWVKADEVANLDLGYKRIPLALRLEEESQQATWLLVFDNANDPTMLADYWPQGSGSILITSRDLLAKNIFTNKPSGLDIGPLSHQDSLSLINHLTGMANEPEDDTVQKISNALGGILLAISQTASIIHRQDLTLLWSTIPDLSEATALLFADLLLGAAWYQNERGRTKESDEFFNTARRIFGFSTHPDRDSQLANIYFCLGGIAMNTNDFDKSRDYKERTFDIVSKTCNKSQAVDERLCLAYAERAISRIQDKRYEEGKVDLEKDLINTALNLWFLDSKVYRNEIARTTSLKGKMFKAMGRAQEAFIAFEHACSLRKEITKEDRRIESLTTEDFDGIVAFGLDEPLSFFLPIVFFFGMLRSSMKNHD
ncbi:Tetratricopeptide-like helical [Penicillium occitanis (nom. inval.)]|nr:Tetratricopeptide-like helical [Penicillium occitanis (nom. inval.)]PCG95965.1 hypothetical protein PENOC_075080 [Penicillium occitanis (nom. inval.)]